MENTGNPFRAGGPLHPGERFIDRQHQSDQIVQAIQKYQSVNVCGPRLIGKTSLFNQVLDRLKNTTEISAHYLTFETISSQEELFRRLARLLGMPEGSPGELASINFEPVLEKARPALFLDEFDRTARYPEKFPPDFFSTLRAWSGQGMVCLIVNTLRPLSEYALGIPSASPFSNIFLSLMLKPLDNNSSIELLSSLSARTAGWPTGWEKQVADLTQGHPWKLQLFGYHAWELLGQNTSTTFQEALTVYQASLDATAPPSISGKQPAARPGAEEGFAQPASAKIDRSAESGANPNTRPQGEKEVVPSAGLAQRIPVPLIGLLIAAGSFAAWLGITTQSTVLWVISLILIFVALLAILVR